MNEWMNEWTNRWINTGMKQWVIMIKWTNEFIEKNLISRICDGSPYERTRNWMNEGMNEWAINVKMNERIVILPIFWTRLAVGWNNCQGHAKFCEKNKPLFFFNEMVG